MNAPPYHPLDPLRWPRLSLGSGGNVAPNVSFNQALDRILVRGPQAPRDDGLRRLAG